MSRSSGRSLSFRIPQLVLLTLTVLLCDLTAVAQQPKVLAPHIPVAPPVEKRLPISMPTVRQSATGGLWMTDANWKAALYLKNGLKTDPITVTPVMYLSNGQRYQLSPITLEPSGTGIVDIGQGLESVGIAPYATLCGYAEIEYQWPWAAVTGTVNNVDVVNSLIYIFGLQPTPDWHPEHMEFVPETLPTSFEGLWWKQEKDVSGFLALSNVTGQAISATVRLTDKSDAQLASYQVTVSPHGTKMIALDELKTAASDLGGVYLTHDGPERGLDLNGGLEDKAAGYSAHLWMQPQPQPFSASSPPSPQTLSFSELFLMTGAADPMMNFPSGTVFTPYSLVRNISDQPAAVTPELWWMAGGAPQSATLPQMTISPHQTVNLNVPALLAAAGLKNFNGYVNLILDSKAQAGGLLMSSGSVDQKNTYVFEVVSHGIAESTSKALCYWSTGNGDDTMVTLWNPADEPQDLAFTLFYTGGQYVYPIQLGPRETRSLNVSSILHTSIPDAAGNVIPAGITDGSAEVAGSLGEQQHVLISLDVAVYNVRKATCGNVCETCNGFVSPIMVANPFVVAVQGTTQQTFAIQYNTGTQYDKTHSSSWSSSNNSVATVSGGLVSGVSAGTATVSALDSLSEPVYTYLCTQPPLPQCPLGYTNPGGSSPGNSQPPPTVSFSNINYVIVGQTATTVATVTPPTGYSSNSLPISLSISSPAAIVSPTGTFTSSTPVVVKGLTAGTATLTATISNADGSKPTVGSTSFPVTSVVPTATVTQRTSGTVSSDDSALQAYGTDVGTTSLGPFVSTTGATEVGCLVGNETVATITPSNYTGMVTLHRLLLSGYVYENSTLYGTPETNVPDTSGPSLRDDNPQSGGSAGKVYALDAPGQTPLYVDGNTYRFRANFAADAELPDGTRISPYYYYYVRVSCNKTSTGFQFVNDVAGDNTIGPGTTVTSWNLQ